MRTSLLQKLNSLIKIRGQISYNDLKKLVESNYFGKYYRMSTVERRLRNESPEVEAEGNPIKSYKWIGTPLQRVQYKILDDFGNTEKVISIIK